MLWWRFADVIFARGSAIDEQLRKFNYVIFQIRENYVEETPIEELIDGAINGMLEALDPHSIYISAEEQSRINEQFSGEFEGIGISFVIQNKILTVISPIPGTPADNLGIRAGDRIVEINGESAFGITNEEVFQKLRGPKGTSVDVTIDRDGLSKPLHITIVRDKIPIHSVETSFMLNESTGYILLNQFSSNTSDELEEALQNLAAQGMNQLILDLRGNSGGYLDQAVKVSDKFIRKGELIVFTRGRDSKSERKYYAQKTDAYEKLDLIVLINHGSASASEIVAGAVQDLDRGLVMGARSFGKGLVQTPIPFEDGSLVRLTTARYYTPSGRLIQRPYDGSLADYYRQAFQDDSLEVKIDSTREVFYTKAKRKVYGGGGIEPDVKLQSQYYTSFTTELLNRRLFFEYAGNYTSEHPELGVNFDYFLHRFNVTDEILEQFVELAKSKDNMVFNQEEYEKDLPYIKNLIKAELAQNLFNGRLYYYQVRITGDAQIQQAVTLFPKAREIASMRKD